MQMLVFYVAYIFILNNYVTILRQEPFFFTYMIHYARSYGSCKIVYTSIEAKNIVCFSIDMH